MGVACKRCSENASSMWHPFLVTTGETGLTKIREALKRLELADAELLAAREALADEIAEAVRTGTRPTDVEREVPYTREHIRRIVRSRDVPAARR
jgi:hypothetical protein